MNDRAVNDRAVNDRAANDRAANDRAANDQPAQPRPLPHHEHHRRTLLAAIAAEQAHQAAAGRRARSPEPASAPGTGYRRLRSLSDEEPSRRRAWAAPAMAAPAVDVVVAAGIGVHALVRPGGQPGQPGTGPGGGSTTATAVTRPPASPTPSAATPSAVGGGELSLTEKYSVAAPVSNLIVNDAAGSVSVASGSGSQVSVTATIYYRTSRPSVSHLVSGRTLTLGYSACGGCGVSFTVTLPRTAGVTVNEHAGKVTVAGLAGDVSISDDTGMVTVDRLTGDVSVQDGTGSITGTGLSAAHASFNDHNGMVDVAFAAPPLRLSAVTDTGMVSVRLPSATTYKVNASSQLGMVDVSVPQSPAATHVITATTNIGMVSVSAGSLVGQ